jgi:glycosyltransferase involved in cell wall biosynthesis
MRAMLSGGIDVIQVSSTPDIYFLITGPLRLLGRRVVFDFKDLSPEIYEARYKRRDGLMYRLLIRFERRSLHVADHVIVVNESVRQVAWRRAGVPAEATTVVGNGPLLANTTRRPPRPELRRGRRYLCCLVGMMGPQDSIDLGIRAISHLVNRIGRTDCAFTFVGTGDAVAEAERMAQRHGIAGWVSFPGWARQEEVFDYLSTADLGIEPNLEEFVSPVKAMEYMAFGLPFVAFDVAETRLLARKAAVFAPPGDVEAFARLLDELLADADRRAELGRAGRRRVAESIAWDHQKERYVAVFDRLAGRNRTKGDVT